MAIKNIKFSALIHFSWGGVNENPTKNALTIEKWKSASCIKLFKLPPLGLSYHDDQGCLYTRFFSFDFTMKTAIEDQKPESVKIFCEDWPTYYCFKIRKPNFPGKSTRSQTIHSRLVESNKIPDCHDRRGELNWALLHRALLIEVPSVNLIVDFWPGIFKPN